MKTLLAIVFLLAWVTPGGAADFSDSQGRKWIEDPTCHGIYHSDRDTLSTRWEPCPEIHMEPHYQRALVELWLEGRSCLAKMEQAMREAEPYIFSWSIRLQRDGSLTIQDVQVFHDMKRTWEAAKQECWRGKE